MAAYMQNIFHPDQSGCYIGMHTCLVDSRVTAGVTARTAGEGAGSNWVSSHPAERITIPTITYGTRDAGALLRQMYDPTAKTYSRRSRVRMYAYRCVPAQACEACAPGAPQMLKQENPLCLSRESLKP
eukprot:9468568-Pyramimonas_sp.AAC.1